MIKNKKGQAAWEIGVIILVVIAVIMGAFFLYRAYGGATTIASQISPSEADNLAQGCRIFLSSNYYDSYCLIFRPAKLDDNTQGYANCDTQRVHDSLVKSGVDTSSMKCPDNAPQIFCAGLANSKKPVKLFYAGGVFNCTIDVVPVVTNTCSSFTDGLGVGKWETICPSGSSQKTVTDTTDLSQHHGEVCCYERINP